MKRTIFLSALILVMALGSTGCAKTEALAMNTDKTAEALAVNVYKPSEAESAETPESVAQAAAQTTPPSNEASGKIELVRYPIPESSQFYGRFDESDNAWMDEDGNIWLGDTQFTYNKESAGNGEIYTGQPTPAMSESEEELVDPATIVEDVPDLKPSNMQLDNYPETWADGTTPWITLDEFNAAIEEKNSNFQPQRDQRAWNNDAITIAAHMYMPGIGSDVYGIEIWDTYERVNTRIEYNDAGGTWYLVDEEGRMSAGLAIDLWCMMAVCDTVTSMEEVQEKEANQEFTFLG